MTFDRRSRFPRALACSGLLILAGSMLPSTPVLAQAPPPAAPAEPVPTSPDYKDFTAAHDLMVKKDFKGAIKAFDAFLAKYKDDSPQSDRATFELGIAHIQDGNYPAAIQSLRKIVASKRVSPAGQESASSYIAKTLAIQASKMPVGSESLVNAQTKAFEEAVKEYDEFLKKYPKSSEREAMLFTKASLLVSMGRFDDAVAGLKGLVAQSASSPIAPDARLLLGRVYTAQIAKLLEKKDRSPADDKAILAAFNEAQPHFVEVYQRSGDIALANDAVFEFGNIQITRAGLTDQAEERTKFLNGALDAYRAVRTTEEVIKAQEDKLARFEEEQKKLPANSPQWELYEKAKEREKEKLDDFKGRKDQSLQARLNIVNIFLELKKPDEARTLLRYVTDVGEASKDPSAQKSVANSLAVSFIVQKNLTKGQEAYDKFRQQFKGAPEGEALPLRLGVAYLDAGQADKAAAVINEGFADYPKWRFSMEASEVLAGGKVEEGKFDEAIEAMKKILEAKPSPEAEMATRYRMGVIYQKKADALKDPKSADEALAIFADVRKRSPDTAIEEKAHYSSCQILPGRDAQKAIIELKAYIDKYSAGKSFDETKEERARNLPVAWHLLAMAHDQTGSKDEAIKDWENLATKYPDSIPAPSSYFKRFDILKDRQPVDGAVKTMEDFIKKYPKHENLYYAYNNMAELLMAKADPEGVDAGAKKLMELVDYEKTAELETKKGDTALLKIAEKWLFQVGKLPPYVAQTNDQKVVWQKALDAVFGVIERLVEQYPKSGSLAEGLSRLVAAQKARTDAKATDAKAVEKYFEDLAAKYDKIPAVKAKINVALASYLKEIDPARALKKLEESIGNPPPPEEVPDPKDPKGKILIPTFTPADSDTYLEALFAAKRYAEMDKIIKRIRDEYPIPAGVEPDKIPKPVQAGQSTALFWEGKILGEQGKTADAATKFSELKKNYPNSTKRMEADYGIILGRVEQGDIQDDDIKTLSAIVNGQTHKTFELPARALFLIARIQKAKGDIDSAIDNFMKIDARYSAIATIAADGLWEGAQLLEAQATGKLPVYTVAQKKARAKKDEEERATAIEAKEKATKSAKPADPAPKPAAKPDAPGNPPKSN